MDMVTTWSDAVQGSLQGLWADFIGFLPQMLMAILTLILFWVVAVLLGRLVERVVKALYVDKGLEKLGVKEGVSKGGLKLNSGAFLGGIVKWFFIFVGLMAFADILNLHQVTAFLNQILMYLPNIIVATIILIIAVLIAGFLEQLVRSSVKAAGLKSSGFLSGLAKWVVLIFAFLAALVQLGVASALIQTLFTGIVAMLAIAGGLAFGMGGKDTASDILKKIKSSL